MNSYHSYAGLLLADEQGNTLVAVGLVIFVAGIVGLLLLPRFTPKGTLLAIAVAIYVASWMIQPGGDRNLHGLVGLLRVLGFIGGVLGIIDLVRKRKS